MDNERSGNLSVINMKKEITESMELLKEGVLHKRAQRQLLDGAKFMEMIAKYPYVTCRTVSELKNKISQEREKLKSQVSEVEQFLPGYQLSLFETDAESIAEEDEALFEAEKKRLDDEITWLHKCLGMCSNRNYFK